MTCINSILESLAADNSRLAKEAILKQNSDNATLREVFRLTLDPLTQFYIKKIPPYVAKGNRKLSLALSDLAQLSERKVTGNAAIDFLKNVLEGLNQNDAKVIEKVIQRDLRCGVSEATANKTWAGLVPEYPVMLASGYDEKLVSKIKFPAACQLKLDGMRFNAIIKDGKVEYRSRNGKPIDLLGALDESILSLFPMKNGNAIVLDGELLVKDAAGILDRKTGNGILNKAVKGTISKEEADLVCATLWDFIPYEDFKSERCKFTYAQRFALLKTAKFNDKVSLVETKMVNSIDEARQLFEEYLAKGQEGTILKDMNAPWEAKRAKHQVKFKGELECDLKCVAWEEGTGKNVGRLGALVLESADGRIRVSVGTGFSDADREVYKPEVVLDKIVAIKYNARIKDKNSDTESLFLPVFVEIREDKTEADNSKVIK